MSEERAFDPEEAASGHIRNALYMLDLGAAIPTDREALRDRLNAALIKVEEIEAIAARIAKLLDGLEPLGVKLKVDWRFDRTSSGPFVVIRNFQKVEIVTADLKRAVEVAREIRAQLKAHHKRVINRL